MAEEMREILISNEIELRNQSETYYNEKTDIAEYMMFFVIDKNQWIANVMNQL